MNELASRTALVTGGSRGIGAAIALALAAKGADVAITYNTSADAAARIVEEIKDRGGRGLAIQADSADPVAITTAVATTVETLGALDILVNNAAAFDFAPLDQLTAEAVNRTLAVNVRAPLLAAQAALPHLREGGRIITIGSNVADRAVFPGFALYSMSKSALTGLTKALARELGPRGITANLVSPGPTHTDAAPTDPAFVEAINAFTALGRFATPEEIAAVVAFLATPSAQYVTGATINADGGFTA
ncbi:MULTISPECIES: SDR family NAD(P)-dependent oxidoreductase [unclassified Crossiella]|uniref:SDR family NAD(P)-dependent oxidoreductase n=1 Tax=unclassified Crossiella TaxID=2620835 RepID=UPI0020002BD7|nr:MULTISPECIES: SDR family oxidoreductase [unclassified Crossiella]MCK2239482.1 SDR family oxidoreductase [Crossiella sp. S99.2]MCK2252177.1 SDR family oxidoreductase [Crossiella sp. S99.1]